MIESAAVLLCGAGVPRRVNFEAQCADTGGVKAILAAVVYVCFMLALAVVAMVSRRNEVCVADDLGD